jgi:glycosyltransferase involved in cell wall biosynthesis
MRFQHAGAHDLHRDAGLDDEVESLAREIPRDGLAMLGYRPAADILPRWNVFVSASRSEAFPLATLEAMSMGIPVVATTVGGLPEQIDHLENGVLVRPDDPEAIATWLVRLSDDPGLRQRLGRAGAERVRTEFTLERQAEGLHRAYLTALNHRFAPSRIRRVP